MTSKINLRTTRWLLAAGLAFGAAAAQAASGVSVTESQETAVKAGMSTTEVEQILGRPAHVVSYRSAPGPTWTYHVFGATPFGMTDFDVSFGADGKVLWASERVLGGAGR
jgi:HAMP domain-containing protein